MTYPNMFYDLQMFPQDVSKFGIIKAVNLCVAISLRSCMVFICLGGGSGVFDLKDYISDIPAPNTVRSHLPLPHILRSLVCSSCVYSTVLLQLPVTHEANLPLSLSFISLSFFMYFLHPSLLLFYDCFAIVRTVKCFSFAFYHIFVLFFLRQYIVLFHLSIAPPWLHCPLPLLLYYLLNVCFAFANYSLLFTTSLLAPPMQIDQLRIVSVVFYVGVVVAVALSAFICNWKASTLSNDNKSVHCHAHNLPVTNPPSWGMCPAVNFQLQRCDS